MILESGRVRDSEPLVSPPRTKPDTPKLVQTNLKVHLCLDKMLFQNRTPSVRAHLSLGRCFLCRGAFIARLLLLQQEPWGPLGVITPLVLDLFVG